MPRKHAYKPVEGEQSGLGVTALHETVQNEGQELRPTGWYRKEIAWLTCLGFVQVYAMRSNLSVAAVDMADELHWSSSLKGLVLASFFIGYVFTQVIGGHLAAKHGGKYVFGLGILATAFGTLVTPIAARTSVGLLIAVRFLEGLGEGVTYPAGHAIFSRWAPSLERSLLVGIAFSGGYLGTVLSLPVSGVLCDSSFLGGWPSVFYVFGLLAVLWFFVWMWRAWSTPEEHPSISAAELRYIQATRGHDDSSDVQAGESLPLIGDSGAADRAKSESKHANTSIPWRSILHSKPVIAIFVGHFANNWGFYTLLTWMPSYFDKVLHFDIKHAGFVSVLPYVALSLSCYLSGFLIDAARARGTTTTRARRVAQTWALLGSGALIFGTGFIPLSDRTGAVVMLTAGSFCMGTSSAAVMVNHLDLSPRLAAVLLGLSNTIATVPGIVSPLITGVIVHDNTVAEWRIVFGITGALNLVGAVVYGSWASGERQAWG